jgi:hypothetical protein
MKTLIRILSSLCLHIVASSFASGISYGADLVQIKNAELVGSFRQVKLSLGDSARLFPGKAVGQMQKYNGGGAMKMEQKKSLKFTIQNSATKTAETFTVQFLIVGRDLKSNKNKVIEKEDASVILNPRENKEITSKEISTEYYVDSGKTMGIKVVGHAIQVYRGNQLVAESYSQTDFKDFFNAGAN